jgi:hypothetical protein
MASFKKLKIVPYDGGGPVFDLSITVNLDAIRTVETDGIINSSITFQNGDVLRVRESPEEITGQPAERPRQRAPFRGVWGRYIMPLFA